jgi:NAD(P)-dependent dehydrogenase (short-subunit alcohol dehydrogenase family)
MRDLSLYLSTIPDYNQMLAGKNVLITTAARGIGKSIALLFARQGADVYFGGRNEEYVRTTEKELQSIRPGCRGYVVDLAKADQTEAFVDAAVKDSGGFDILVSTVGVNCHCPAAEYKDEDMFRLLETNYLSGVRCARKVIPTMQARGGGSIINISSIHSLMSQPTNMLYAGTKGAMNAAARVMALDYAKDNIRVNTICPGVVISDVMYDDMDKLDDAGKKQLDAALHRCQPLEPGRMQDIANTALFFASNMSANITGQTLLSDGGTSIKAHDMDC